MNCETIEALTLFDALFERFQAGDMSLSDDYVLGYAHALFRLGVITSERWHAVIDRSPLTA